MSLPRPLFWTFTLLLVLFVFAAALRGESIWDDNFFIFWRYAQNPNLSHQFIWAHHLWPLFDSITKELYSLWGMNTSYWHALNLVLHLLNGLLIGRLVGRWRKSWQTPITLLFWIHPLNMLSVAWIIQLKTLLAGLGALLAVELGFSWVESGKWRYYLATWLCFALSLAAKSSALSLPLLAILGAWPLKRKERHRLLTLALPFIGLCLLAYWRTILNPGVQTSLLAARPAFEHISLPLFLMHTLFSYIAMPWLPWPLSPYHGAAYENGVTLWMMLGIVLTISCGWLTYRLRDRTPLTLLLTQVLMMIPFSGLVLAPYMTYSAVSEQHLYFMLPVAFCLQLWCWEKIRAPWQLPILCVGVLALSVLSVHYSQSFRNEEAFFLRVLSVRPHDSMAALNLAAHYARLGYYQKALAVIDQNSGATHDQTKRPDTLKLQLEQARQLYQAQATAHKLLK